ncbi:hypothetical protein [Streptomyces antimycoticus]|uniref:hypothetical protein n=1 Tax=Streptomyces antimycoticus TaxID=68175 RepID=UPI0036AAE2F6
MAALHRQITGHLKYAGFALVVAYAGGTPAGFGYAFPCSATTGSALAWSTRCPRALAPSV